MLTYLLAHALVKSGLFFLAGILLQQLRSISEPALFRRGRGMRWSGVLWILGGAGLAAAPPFSTLLGEAGASRAADLAGVPGVSLLFLLGGVLTGGAVLRVGMHTFLGWGAPPLTDRSAKVDEAPETRGEDAQILWYHFTPAAVCILGAAMITFLPGWQAYLSSGAASLSNQSAYLQRFTAGRAPFWRRLPGAMRSPALPFVV